MTLSRTCDVLSRQAHPRAAREGTYWLAGSLRRQVADPVALDDNPEGDRGVALRVDPVGGEIGDAVGTKDADDDIVDDVALGRDGEGFGAQWKAAGVDDGVAPDDAAGAADFDADVSALVDQIVLDDIVASGFHMDAP